MRGHAGHWGLFPLRGAGNAATHRIDADAGVFAIPCRIRRRDDDHRRGIGGRIAIQQAKGRRDHPGRQIIVHGHGIAEDALGVLGRAAPGGKGDLAEMLALGAIKMEVTLGIKREPVAGRQTVKGQNILHLAIDAGALGGGFGMLLPRGAARAFLHRAEAQHVAGEASLHRGIGVDDRADLRRTLNSPGKPAQLQPQRVAHGIRAHRAERRHVAAIARIGRQAVDILHGETGVGNRLQRGIDGQLQPRLRQLAPHGRLANPTDNHCRCRHRLSPLLIHMPLWRISHRRCASTYR